MESGFQEEEFFPATKGVTLANALNQALKRRNLSLSQLNIIDINDDNSAHHLLEAKCKPLHGSLDINTEVDQLAGRHFMITDKDGSRKTLQKAASFGSRSRPPRLLSSASTDESSDVNLSGKQLKQRWSGLFGIKNPQQIQLCELLNKYSKNGVPVKTVPTYDFEHPDLEAAIAYLDNIHKSWKDVVRSDDMSESEIRVQTAIWELVTTEVDYIHCLQTVTDLFLACLEAVQDEGLLQDVDQHRLFANIRKICEANLKLWSSYLYPMVSHSIAMNEPLRISFFQSGFIHFANIFSPYKKYCAEQSSCQFYCKELTRTNSVFTSYLAWCEAQKMCNRLRLADILVRPMQRLTKYSLLLAAIKKHMTDGEEIEAIDAMLQNTENFVFSVNNHLTTRQENERLKGVMARIESYDVVDTNNEHLDKLIKQHSQMFDLCGPMKGCAPQHVRHLFMEGDHKYKDNHGKADVHCFLLTDMLLVCKSIAKKGMGSLKVIRQPYLTDRLIVQHTNNLLSFVYLNEFQVATTAFTLQCTEAKNWYESLKRAKMAYVRLKRCWTSNWENSLRYAGSIISGTGTTESLGVKKSPLNSSTCSHVTSANNSHSGSVEWNDSRNISVEFEKSNSLSSDEGCSYLGAHGFPMKAKPVNTTSPQKLKINTVSTANTLTVQPRHHLGQSLPNLTVHHSHTTNTLLVPGTTSSHSRNILLAPSHRGVSYPPPSPSRVPLQRGMAFSCSIKNPPLLKTRNITSQNSINWHQIPATPTPTSPTNHQEPSQPAHQSLQSKTGEPENTNVTSPSTLNNSLAYISNSLPDTTLSETSSSRSSILPPVSGNQTFTTQLSNTETDI
uniref:DH domain-containing protein n=1 Tax=Glossina brevipalpis TaxID=37001 RepID=A0A1A9WRI3_9MUSC